MLIESTLAIFLAMTAVAAPALAAESDTPLTLSPTRLGALALGKNAKVSEGGLKKLFPAHTVKYDIGQGDSPDFHYFEVLNLRGEVLFTIRSFIEGSAESKKTNSEVPIHLLKVYSPLIRDSYGVRVGDRVKDIIAKRGKELAFGASHHDVYFGASRIFYNVATEREESPENITIEDAVKGNWQIRSISWPQPAWD